MLLDFSSGIVWEAAKKKRFKPLSNRRNDQLEAAFQDFALKKAAGHKPNPQVTIDKATVRHFHSPTWPHRDVVLLNAVLAI